MCGVFVCEFKNVSRLCLFYFIAFCAIVAAWISYLETNEAKKIGLLWTYKTLFRSHRVYTKRWADTDNQRTTSSRRCCQTDRCGSRSVALSSSRRTSGRQRSETPPWASSRYDITWHSILPLSTINGHISRQFIFLLSIGNKVSLHCKGGITLERKWKRKRHRLEWIHRFPSYVFTLGSGKDQRNFRFRFRVRFNIIPP